MKFRDLCEYYEFCSEEGNRYVLPEFLIETFEERQSSESQDIFSVKTKSGKEFEAKFNYYTAKDVVNKAGIKKLQTKQQNDVSVGYESIIDIFKTNSDKEMVAVVFSDSDGNYKATNNVKQEAYEVIVSLKACAVRSLSKFNRRDKIICVLFRVSKAEMEKRIGIYTRMINSAYPNLSNTLIDTITEARDNLVYFF